MATPDRHLVILCSNFPFGFGEPFLDVELNYLTSHFTQITICTTSEESEKSKHQFEVPEHVNVVSVKPTISWFEKAFSVWRLLFDSEIREEIRTIKNAYHSPVSWGKLKTMLVSKLRALKIKSALQKVVSTNENTFFYSYWADDAALALSYLKTENSSITAFCRLHGWDLYFERSFYHYLPFRKRIFNGLDAVFAISENGRNYLLSHFDTIIDKGRIYQSRLGIRTVDKFEEHGRSFRRFKLISCSNLIPIKRVELIVKALSHIKELEVDWVHFGDGTELEEIRKMSDNLLQNKENIDFHFPGRIPNWEVLQYYSNHMVDLFVTLSRYDGIPVSIMEAMSFGIPAVATNVGGVSEIVINGKTGFLLDQEVSPKDVAEVIEHVAAMKTEDYESMRKEAKNVWGTFYSADINYPDFCKRILSLKS
ncbi:MAG: glycosyltransferase [Flavobacteriales bacterium]|nr:glycosyltransferase [Flavobacteriales bacterium]